MLPSCLLTRRSEADLGFLVISLTAGRLRRNLPYFCCMKFPVCLYWEFCK